jgi:hypothetical protein
VEHVSDISIDVTYNGSCYGIDGSFVRVLRRREVRTLVTPPPTGGVRTSFSIPDDVLDAFDRVWQEEDLENRSRAVREAMIESVEAHARLEATEGEVVALVGFDDRHDEVIRELHGVQHDFQDVIRNTVTLTRASGVSSRCSSAMPGGP